MKYLGLLSLTFGLIILGCNYDNKSNVSITSNTETIKSSNDSKDKEEIQNLIRQMLNWADSDNSIDLLPILSKDSICIGFDFEKHKLNLEKLRKTEFFAEEFIENYNQIILTLDKNIKNEEFDPWNIYEYPTFRFANGADIWCLCQDVPYDKPNPWDFIEVEIMDLNKRGELFWKWGKLELNRDPSWKEFKYRFEVVKMNDSWKISYLQGFDFIESTKKDGL